MSVCDGWESSGCLIRESAWLTRKENCQGRGCGGVGLGLSADVAASLSAPCCGEDGPRRPAAGGPAGLCFITREAQLSPLTFFFYVMQVLRRVLVTGRDVQGHEARTGRAGAEMKGAVPSAEGVGRPRPGRERGSPNQHVHSSQGAFAEFNASSKCRYGLCMRQIFISSFSCTANFIMHIHLRSIPPNR